MASHHHVYDPESVRAILAMHEPESAAKPGSLPPTQLGRWPEAGVPAVESEAYGWLTDGVRGGAAE